MPIELSARGEVRLSSKETLIATGGSSTEFFFVGGGGATVDDIPAIARVYQ